MTSLLGRDGGGTPDRCRLEIHVGNPSAADALTDLLLPLLEGIDPALNLITIHTPASAPAHRSKVNIQDIETLLKMNQPFNSTGLGAHGTSNNQVCSRVDSNKLRTPSLAVMLFLNERGPISTERAQNYLRTSPWRFHHKIELSNARKNDMRVVGRQEFYQPGPHQPLWSVCPVHYGNEHLRFTIFTRHFSSMVDFYRLLLGQEADFTRANFCLFTLYGQPGLDIQLALKQCSQLDPDPMTSAFLTIRVANVRQLEALLRTPHEATRTLGRVDGDLWLMRDPDGNGVLVEEQEGDEDFSTGRFSPGRLGLLVPNNTETRTVGPWRKPNKRDERCSRSAYRTTPSNEKSPQCFCRSFHTSPPRRTRSDDSRMECWPRPLYTRDDGCSKPLRNVQRSGWSDRSSYDSGRHSWRSCDLSVTDSSMAESSSLIGGGDLSPVSPVLPCDCDVTSGGSCSNCLARSRTLLRQRLQGSSLNTSSSGMKVKPWEIDVPSLCESELDDLLSLTGIDDIESVKLWH